MIYRYNLFYHYKVIKQYKSYTYIILIIHIFHMSNNWTFFPKTSSEQQVGCSPSIPSREVTLLSPSIQGGHHMDPPKLGPA